MSQAITALRVRTARDLMIRAHDAYWRAFGVWTGAAVDMVGCPDIQVAAKCTIAKDDLASAAYALADTVRSYLAECKK